MTTIGRKIVRDFWGERTRTFLVALAIALGVAAFASVLSSYAVLTRELDAGYLATNPAAATIFADAIDETTLRAARSVPGVADAEPRRAVPGRVKAGPAGWKNLVLFALADFRDIRISRVARQEGAWPPGEGEILIERDAVGVARARIGQTVEVRLGDGEAQPLRLVGTVRDVGQAQARMENVVYGYVTPATLSKLGVEPSFDRLQITVTDGRLDERHIRAVAADVRRVLESRGHPVTRVEIPAPGRHPHADLMAMLLLAMSSFGLFVLLVAAIIVINLLTALVAAQRRQIGIMKAVGATPRDILRIYLGQAILLGAAALALAIPASVVGSRALCRSMAKFLNFDISSFAPPPWVGLLVLAVGLVVPVLAAFLPARRGARMSVGTALADFGVSPASFGSRRAERLLIRLAGPARPLLYAVRNCIRRRGRLALTLTSLVVGGIFFLSALNVRASMIRTLDSLFATKKYDLSVTFANMVSADDFDRAASAIPGFRISEGWITTQGSLPSGRAPAGPSIRHGAAGGGPHAGGASVDSDDRFAVVAIPTPSKVQAPELLAGRALAPGDDDSVVLNSALARKFGIRAGQRIAIRMGPFRRTWRVVGIAREPFSPPAACVPRRYFDEVGGHTGLANNYRIALSASDAASIARARAELETRLGHAGLSPVAITTKADLRVGFDQHLLMIYVFLVIVSALLAGVAGLGLSTTMSINVLERRRELGIVRAIGATPAFVGAIVVTEACVIALAGGVVGALVAWPVGRAIANFVTSLAFQSPLDSVYEPGALFAWLAACLAIGVASSGLPAWHASQASVRRSLEYE